MRPNFLVIGSMKCGTTSLCVQIHNHPDAFIVRGQNPDFFAKDCVYERGFGWYEKLFTVGENKIAVGENSNSYSETDNYPKTVRRIWNYDPEMKLIYLVRNPIRRIESRWIQLSSQSMTHFEFNRAVKEDICGYIHASNYLRQYNRFRELFKESQILVLFAEDLFTSPENVVRTCYRFLKLKEDVPLREPNKNTNPYSNKKTDSRFTYLIINNPFFQAMKWTVPSKIRSACKIFMQNKIHRRPFWKVSTYEYVKQQLQNDTMLFLRHFKKADDFWKIDCNV